MACLSVSFCAEFKNLDQAPQQQARRTHLKRGETGADHTPHLALSTRQL